MEALGRHILVEFYGCSKEVLSHVNEIQHLMNSAADAAGATIVDSVFHQFNPYGVSGVVVIAESHLAIHTWPENGYASIDLFTCGMSVDPWLAFDLLKEKLQPTHVRYAELKRGELDERGDLEPIRPLQVDRQLIA